MNEDESRYDGLSRAELEQRLRLAEDACVYFGWSAAIGGSDRADAATEVWQRWARHPGVDTSVKGNAELANAETSLAAARRATRAATLGRIRGSAVALPEPTKGQP